MDTAKTKFATRSRTGTDLISSSAEPNEGNLVFESICRCCLTNDVELKPIFSSVGSIPEAIFLFTAVKFAEDDRLPGNICINCLHQLNKCFSFKRKVESVDLILRKYLTELDQKAIVDDTATELVDSPQEQSCKQSEEMRLGNATAISSVEGFRENNWDAQYTCTVCIRSYGSRCAYNRHIKAHVTQDNSFRCNECGKRFTDKTIFEAHQICHTQKNTNTATTGQVYICEFCKDIFGVEEDLFVHGSLHEVDNKINCKACGKDFENIAKLKRHIPMHFMEKPFKCTKCDMSFSEMASLTRHYSKHMGQKRKSIHICLVCGKPFPNQYTLKVHTRKHSGERPWECTKCEKRFTDYRLLNSHKKLHEEGKPFQCEECENKFRHHSTLITHMRTHTGDRPYRCDKCKKSYKQSWSLRIHKRTHADNKRFLCDKCSQMFTTLTSLKDHFQGHSDENDTDNREPHTEAPPEFFHCKDCSAQFPSRLDLITHEKLTHALRHECDTCFGKWKTLEELVQHKCDEALEVSDEPTPDEMILLPNGEIQDCNTVVNALLASISHPATMAGEKARTEQA